MSFVGNAMSSATDFLVGGEQRPATQTHDAMTDAENKRFNDIETELKKMFSDEKVRELDPKDQRLQNLFRDTFINFVSKDFGTSPSPEQLQQATSFVDQTFTTPMRAAMKQTQADTEAALQAKAAALGRNPNADIATQQAIMSEIAKQTMGLQNERSSRIAQTAMGLNDLAYNRGLKRLDAAGMGNAGAMQNTSFLNGLAQQAFANRMALLNGRSSLNDFLQRERLANTSYMPATTSSGFLTNFTAINNGISDAMVSTDGTKQLNSMQKPFLDFMGGVGSAGGSGGGGGGGGGGAGAIMGMASMFSDERLKTDIRDASDELYDFLDNVHPYNYTYTNNELNLTPRSVSVMAQDLEKSSVGQTFVINTPKGKMVDYSKMVGVLLASNAALHERIKKLEGRV